MKTLIIILFIFFFHVGLVAQTSTNIDSLISALDTNKIDTNQINLLLEISNRIGYNDAFRALEYAKKGLKIAVTIQDTNKQFYAATQMSNVYHILGDYNNGIEYALRGLKIAEKTNDSFKIGNAYNILGLTYKVMGLHQKSLTYFIKSFQLVSKNKSLKIKAKIANNIANEYFYLKEYEKALKYHQIALNIRKDLNDMNGISASYNDMGGVYLEMKNFEMADSLLNVSLKMKIEIKDSEGIAMASGNLGILKYKQKKYKKAINLLTRSLKIAEKINVPGIALEDLECLSKAYEEMGSTDKGFLYYKKFITLKDSLKNEDNARAFTQKEMKFEYDKKALADSLRNIQEKTFMQEQNKRKVQKQKFYTIGSIFGVIALLIIALLLVISNKRKSKDNKTITSQKNTLVEQHKEITDSINYAKRIQTALLTEDVEWQKISKEYFVFFKPKDVVSGDFFWAYHNQKRNLSIWVAADCTGHGVPGAFMSMLGIGFLNDIIIENDVTQSFEILNQLRKKIINALQQKNVNVQQKDGMDLALCLWDKNKNTLEFSGANNPLWLLRDTKYISNEQKKDSKTLFNKEKTKAIVTYRPNKMPIGSYSEEDKSFSSITIELQKGDVIYTFSDGFADQFGGEKGKKLKYKPFKELLLKNNSESIIKQKEYLDYQFENWKGNLEQIDDVCVIGVRV